MPSAGWAGGERGTFVHIARPAEPSGVGLVIVPPFGFEGLCAWRPLRHLAERAATAGLLAVRVDVDGTGDSTGDDLDPARLEAWVTSVGVACDVARSEGADRIVLCGVRIGALIAALAAGRRADVAGFVGIAAVATGKAWLREAKMMQGALGLAPAPAGSGDEHDELVGFAITGETRAALQQIDLTRSAAPAPSVLLIDRDNMPGNDKWAQAIGAEVVRLPGYTEMVLDPHRAQVPEQIFAKVIAYARAVPAIEPVPAAPVEVRARHGGEEVVDIAGMAAVVARPTGRPTRAVILLNAGATRRIGPNRLHVALARRLAADGDLVVRVDLSGLGDSPTRAGSRDNEVYSRHAVDDVGAVVAWTRTQGATRVAAVGLCSGAYHAQKAAAAGQPIDLVVPINPLTFYWTPDTPLDTVLAHQVTAETQRYRESMFSKASWQKLLRGEVDVKRVAGIVARKASSVIEHRARALLRKLHVTLPRDLGSELAALVRRGVVVEYIFASSDPGHAMLLEQGGAIVDTLAVQLIEGPDHTFTPRWSHPRFLEAVVRAVHR